MPSPDPPLGYLRHVLRDGARLYLYRSGVRRLLGLPETGAEVAYAAATTPPVGFRYLGRPWPAAGFPTRGLGMERPRDSAHHPRPRYRDSPHDGDAPPELLPSTAPHQDPAGPAHRSRVEVPGVSESRRHFPALADEGSTAGAPPPPAETPPTRSSPGERPSPPASAPDRPTSKAIGLSSGSREAAPPIATPESRSPATPESRWPAPKEDPKPRSDRAPAATAYASAAPPVFPSAPSKPPARKVSPPGGRRKEPAEAALAGSGQTVSEPPRDEPSSAAVSSALAHRARPARAAMTAGEPPEPLGALVPAAPFGNLLPARMAGRRVELTAVEGLEKVRQAVHQMASRTATPSVHESAPEPQAAERAKPAAAQPAPAVVVRTPPPSRTPDAFWERSYLNHSLLRTLR